MPVIVDQPPDTIRKFRIEFGEEWCAMDFGREISRAKALKMARLMLDSFGDKPAAMLNERQSHE